MSDISLCGDETCESPGCKQSAIDAYYAKMGQNAKDFLVHLASLPLEQQLEEIGAIRW